MNLSQAKAHLSKDTSIRIKVRFTLNAALAHRASERFAVDAVRPPAPEG